MLGVLYRGKSCISIFLLLAVLCIGSCSDIFELKSDKYTADQANSQKVNIYTYRIVNRYPHDKDAFTQGLVFKDGVIYEGTGLYGKSSLRKVELETGYVLQLYELPAQYFGEGVTVFNDIIIIPYDLAYTVKKLIF